MKTVSPLAIGLIWLASCSSIPHGEGELGSHGGYVKMPADYHIEIVPQDQRRFDAYLEDLQSRSPITTASQLRGELNQEGTVQTVTCQPVNDHFVCELPEGASLDRGSLTLYAVRREDTGRPVTYELPLRLPSG